MQGVLPRFSVQRKRTLRSKVLPRERTLHTPKALRTLCTDGLATASHKAHLCFGAGLARTIRAQHAQLALVRIVYRNKRPVCLHSLGDLVPVSITKLVERTDRGSNCSRCI